MPQPTTQETPASLSRSAWTTRTLHSGDLLSSAAVALQGGQVISWNHRGRERLYLSDRAVFSDDQAIRGGVPIIFPQFADRGTGRRHGYARLTTWLPRVGRRRDRCTLDLPSNGARSRSPTLRLSVQTTVGNDRLTLEASVENRGGAPGEFCLALHTYLAVRDVGRCTITGMLGCRYIDSAGGALERIDDREQIDFGPEIDRIYLSAPSQVVLHDEGDPLIIRQSGFTDTVVWNPGQAKGEQIGDMAPGDHLRFVCVEAAIVGQSVRLAPGHRWRGRQVLIG